MTSRLWNSCLVGIAALATISCHDTLPDAPVDPGLPIDSKILITFAETLSSSGRSFLMRARTERIYACVNYRLRYDLTRSGSNMRVLFHDVTIGAVCFTATGPATASLDLGDLPSGTYSFIFQAPTGTTRTDLRVDDDAYTVASVQGESVVFPSPVLRRIPDDTIWGLIGYLGHPWEAPFDSLADSFLDSLAAAGADPITLEPGDYGDFWVDSTGAMKWPGTTGYYDARPYVLRYDGDYQRLGEIIATFGRTQGQYLSIRLLTWKGDTYATWLATPGSAGLRSLSNAFNFGSESRQTGTNPGTISPNPPEHAEVGNR